MPAQSRFSVLVISRSSPSHRILSRDGRAMEWSGSRRKCHPSLLIPLQFQCQPPCQPDARPITDMPRIAGLRAVGNPRSGHPCDSPLSRGFGMELTGFEPVTPSLRTRCSTPCRPGQTPENPCGIDDLGSRRSSSFCVVFGAHVVAMWSRANVTDRKREPLEQRCRPSLLAFHCTSTLCTRNDAGSRSSCGG